MTPKFTTDQKVHNQILGYDATVVDSNANTQGRTAYKVRHASGQILSGISESALVPAVVEPGTFDFNFEG